MARRRARRRATRYAPIPCAAAPRICRKPPPAGSRCAFGHLVQFVGKSSHVPIVAQEEGDEEEGDEEEEEEPAAVPPKPSSSALLHSTLCEQWTSDADSLATRR